MAVPSKVSTSPRRIRPAAGSPCPFEIVIRSGIDARPLTVFDLRGPSIHPITGCPPPAAMDRQEFRESTRPPRPENTARPGAFQAVMLRRASN
ncbi:hypothetical protein JCM2811A_44260 [Methylorubrum rhodinum]